MTFELIPGLVAKPNESSDCAARFTLEQGAFAGQAFIARMRVCANPCCGCGSGKKYKKCCGCA